MKRPAKDQMPRVWLGLLLAVGFLLAAQAGHRFLPEPLRSAWRQTRFFLPSQNAVAIEPFVDAPPDAEKPPKHLPRAHSSRSRIRRLFADLKRGRRHELRIAYFADSVTEGDVLTGELRRRLQRRFGGSGAGWRGLAPRDADFALALRQRHDPSWRRIGLLEPRTATVGAAVMGIAGDAYRLPESGRAWVKARAPRSDPGALGSRVRLFYGPPREGARPAETVLAQAGGKAALLDLRGAGALNALALPAGGELRLEFDASPQRDFYGLSFESPRGLLLDSFTLRGHGGEGLVRLEGPLLRAFQRELGYELVLLHFGLNALEEGLKDYRWYRKALRRSLAHLKRHLPGAQIAVVSVLDLARRGRQGRWRSDRSIPYVLAAQRAAAADEGLPFIDLFHAMGGAGSMRRWVESRPPLAYRDHMHPNEAGGAALAGMLMDELLGETGGGRGE